MFVKFHIRVKSIEIWLNALKFEVNSANGRHGIFNKELPDCYAKLVNKITQVISRIVSSAEVRNTHDDLVLRKRKTRDSHWGWGEPCD